MPRALYTVEEGTIIGNAPKVMKGYEKYMPKRYRRLLLDIKHDREILSCLKDIELYEARKIEVMQGMDKAPYGRIWDMLATSVDRLQTAKEQGDKEGVANSLTNIIKLVRRGANKAQSFKELDKLTAMQSSLKSLEHKRINDAEKTMNARQLGWLMLQLLAVIQKHVTDDDVSGKIADEFEQLFVVDPDADADAA